MEAIFRDGGRQYKVREGSTVDVDYREVEPGNEIEFDHVLFVKDEEASSAEKAAVKIGTPRVEGAKVVGKVVAHTKGPKLIVMHFRRRKNSKTRFGHRQRLTQVKIEKIEA